MSLLRWLKRWIETLDLLPEYFTAAIGQWQAVLWGVSMPALVWGIWFILGTPPQWMNVAAIFSGLFIAGYYVWRADHVRLQPKLKVTRVIPQPWESGIAAFYSNSPMPPARGVDPHHLMAYYFEISSTSEALTLRDVRVELADIVPPVKNLDWLPVLLYHKHDDPPHKEKFDLHPGGIKHIDLVSAHQRDDHFEVRHIVDGRNRNVPSSGHHCLTVVITATDTPKLLVSFDVFMDAEGVLQCNLL